MVATSQEPIFDHLKVAAEILYNEIQGRGRDESVLIIQGFLSRAYATGGLKSKESETQKWSPEHDDPRKIQ